MWDPKIEIQEERTDGDVFEPIVLPSGTEADITRLSFAELSEALSAAPAGPVSVAAIVQQIREGAPVNPDGTIHLIHFTAWLRKSMNDDGPS